MSRPSKLVSLLSAYSVNDLEKLVHAKKLAAERDELRDQQQELTAELKTVNRRIRRTERAIAKALKAGKKRVVRHRKLKVKRTSRRGGRKGVLLGLRPTSLAHQVHTFIAKAPNKQARVSEIVQGLKGWKGKKEGELMRHVGATLTKRNAYFKKVERGVYTLAAN